MTSRIHNSILFTTISLLLYCLPIQSQAPSESRIIQFTDGKAIRRNYPYALPSLLKHIHGETTFNVDEQPVIIRSFEDPLLLEHPFVYINFADRKDWNFSLLEQQNLKTYLDNGGFIFIDAGINSEFLRQSSEFGQHHSFADWDACPAVKEAFKTIYPEKNFTPLSRSHEIFSTFYSGLPDASILPDSVREFVINEKWPDGTYSFVALTVNGRVAVLATPIIAMGWGKDPLGNWANKISFRIREGTKNMGERLQDAAYFGKRFEAVREDGLTDIIYCQRQATPSWAKEADGDWRIFSYYSGNEISDYAHTFYTRLGTNIFVYALTH